MQSCFENFHVGIWTCGAALHPEEMKIFGENREKIVLELDQLMSNFEIRKNSLDKKLTNIQKEKEMYDKAINLINSLKNV